MSHIEDEAEVKTDRSLVIGALIAFLGLLIAYVTLSALDKDAEGVVRLVATLAGIFGLGVYNRAQHKSQVRRLDKITEQTNGVLTRRIEEGTVSALRQILTDEQIIAGTEKVVRNALAAQGVERVADPDDDGTRARP